MGGGKSYFAMMQIEDELRLTDRCIVTNIDPLYVEEIAEYLHNKYGQTYNIHSRIRVIDTRQAFYFYRHRADYELGTTQRDNGNAGMGKTVEVITDYTTLRQDTDKGCLYIIDELHWFFNARQWAKTGKDVLDYLTLHRKLRDDVIWMSQRPKQVDSQFRELTEDWIYLKNYARKSAKFLGIPFAMGRKLVARCYGEQKQMGPAGATQIEQWSKKFVVKPEIYGKWYDTSSGAGIKGGGTADKTLPNMTKGFNIKWAFAVLALIPLSMAAFWYFYGRGATRIYGDAVQATVREETIVQPETRTKVTAPEQTQAITTETNDLTRFVKFQIRKDGFVELETKDGVKLTSADGIQLIGKQGFRYKGRLYPLP